MSETFGGLVRAARAAAGKSLRQVGEAMGGLSAPYLHDVEHDRRRIVPARWAALIAALPALNIRALAVAALSSGPVEIDARDITDEQRARLVDALVEHATNARQTAATADAT